MVFPAFWLVPAAESDDRPGRVEVQNERNRAARSDLDVSRIQFYAGLRAAGDFYRIFSQHAGSDHIVLVEAVEPQDLLIPEQPGIADEQPYLIESSIGQIP